MSTPNHWIVTGNFTDEGAGAYRRADVTWSRRIADAGLLPDAATATAHATHALAHEQREVASAYAIAVHADAGAIDPTAPPFGGADGPGQARTIELLTTRERIRATGPTIQIRRPDSPR